MIYYIKWYSNYIMTGLLIHNIDEQNLMVLTLCMDEAE